VRERVADADAGERVGFRERAHDDEIRVTREERHRVFRREGRVGFVDDEQAAERREHALEVGVGKRDAGRGVGRGQEKRAGGRGRDALQRQTHRAVELDHVGRAVLNLHEHRIERVARQRVARRGVLRAKGADEQIQNIVGAVADTDVLRVRPSPWCAAMAARSGELFGFG
jgi:hypothetical protein